MEMYNPAHPGRLLREEMGDNLTVTALSKHLGVTRAQLSMILNERAGVSPLMSLKLDEAFDTTPGFWFRVQQQYDLAKARRTKRRKVPALKRTLLKAA